MAPKAKMAPPVNKRTRVKSPLKKMKVLMEKAILLALERGEVPIKDVILLYLRIAAVPTAPRGPARNKELLVGVPATATPTEDTTENQLLDIIREAVEGK